MNGKVQSAVAIEIHGKFPEGGIRQRQDPRRTVGHQDAQSGGFIAAAHAKAPVKVLIARSDGFDAQKPVQPLSRPDGQPCGKRAAEFTQQPLAGIGLMLGFLPLSAFLAPKRVHLRQLDGAQLRSQSLICTADVPAAAAIAVAGQRDVRVLGVEKMRSGIDLHVLEHGAHRIRRDRPEGLLPRLFSGFSLYRLPQCEDHATQNDRHDVAAQDHACHSDDHSHQGEESTGQFAALVPAQLLRERLVCHASVLFFHILLLIPPRRSKPGSP